MSKQKSMGQVSIDLESKWCKNNSLTDTDDLRRMHQYIARCIIAEHERRKRAKAKKGKK